mmetsp:Transcript_7905/g.22438  ORF Transcript_7905/g.22438 Transcript_7905/m.22438 type:complete len:382 (+) Transcript_7905:419-1564(+)
MQRYDSRRGCSRLNSGQLTTLKLSCLMFAWLLGFVGVRASDHVRLMAKILSPSRSLTASLVQTPCVEDPAADGRMEWKSYTTSPRLRKGRFGGLFGAALSMRIYYPKAKTTKWPLVVVAHGFASSSKQHRTQARYLASRGYVAIAPDFANGILGLNPNHWRNADDINTVVEWALNETKGEGAKGEESQLFGIIDHVKPMVGAIGHSAGGFAVLLAAAEKDTRIKAVALMDPVGDKAGRGLKDLRKIRCASAVTHSPASPCNDPKRDDIDEASAVELYDNLRAKPRRKILILNSYHLDGQDPPLGKTSPWLRPFVRRACEGISTEFCRKLYRRYTFGWLDYYLKDKETQLRVKPYVFRTRNRDEGLAHDLDSGLLGDYIQSG